MAKAGYYAIAPELYARQGDPSKYTDIPTLISEIVVKVPTDQVMSDLDAAAAYAKGSGKADTTKLAVTGFCWGGWATWMYSAHNPDLKAAVAWYGTDRKPSELTPKNPLDIAADVKCPVLALYGGADQSIPQETIEKRQAACKAAGKTCEFAHLPRRPARLQRRLPAELSRRRRQGRLGENAGLVQGSRGRIGAGFQGRSPGLAVAAPGVERIREQLPALTRGRP